MAFNKVNVNGIPCIENTSVGTTATTVTYNFNPSPAVSPRFSGLIAIRITESSDESLPVSLNVPSIAGTSIALTTFEGAAVTTDTFEIGIHIVFYDRFNGIMQLIV